VDDDRQHAHQSHLHYRRHSHLPLTTYFDAGLAAGAAAFSSLTGVLFAGFFSSFLTAGAGAAGALTVAAGAAGLVSSFLAGACANADTANTVARIAIVDFILKFPFG
jgi:hypothetical protein